MQIKSKIRRWLPHLILILIIGGQLYYLPERFAFWCQLLTFARAEDTIALARLAYDPADYDLLAWVERETSPQTTLLLLTASPHAYGDPSYVLYHRALYYLYPRSVWWAAPVTPTGYPAWWSFSDLTETDILNIAQERRVSAILADGFSRLPVSGSSRSFDEDTHLIFLETPIAKNGRQPVVGHQRLIFLKILGALCSIWMWGDLLYGLIARWLPTPSKAGRIAIAWLWGCGLTSLATFILLWVGLSLATAVAGLSLAALLLWLSRYANNVPSLSLAHALPGCLSYRHLIILILLTQISLVISAALLAPLTDWDAWVNWAGKANLIFIDQTISTNLYNNPARLPTNMDYPLMLPLVEAWFYSWVGQIHEPSIGLISLLFYSALLLLFYQASRHFVSSATALGFTALLATIPRLERSAHSGLADIPLAALVLLSFLLLCYIFYDHSSLSSYFLIPRVAILALSTGLLPWLKSEGWFWLLLMTLALVLKLIMEVRHGKLSGRQAMMVAGCYFGLTLSIASLWPAFLATHGTIRFTFLPLTLSNFLIHLPRWPIILVNMLARLLNPYWNFVWLFVGVIVVARRAGVFFAPVGWLILPIAGYLALISLTYIFSRFDPYLAHLNNSAERLFLQAAPLALWWFLGQSIALGWIKRHNGE